MFSLLHPPLFPGERDGDTLSAGGARDAALHGRRGRGSLSYPAEAREKGQDGPGERVIQPNRPRGQAGLETVGREAWGVGRVNKVC